ncbi:MAG: hypothetical protein ACF788_13790 [Novipirellula sp. JB048]
MPIAALAIAQAAPLAVTLGPFAPLGPLGLFSPFLTLSPLSLFCPLGSFPLGAFLTFGMFAPLRLLAAASLARRGLGVTQAAAYQTQGARDQQDPGKPFAGKKEQLG